MVTTRKNTRVGGKSLDSDLENMPDKKTTKPRPRGRPPKSATASASIAKKEPVRRGRRRKVPEDEPLLLDVAEKKPAKTTKLDATEMPVLISESRRFLNTASTSGEVAVTESEILKATDADSLVKLIDSLVNTQQDAIFDKYRQTSKLQMSHDSSLISSLREELTKKQDLIDALQAQLLAKGDDGDTTAFSVPSSTPRRQTKPEMYQSPIRKQSSSSLMIHQEDLANELKTIGITLDMQELLTGVRIINYEEDRDKFYFDVKQTSTNIDNDSDAVSVVYRLVIKKKFEQTAEVTYVPSFLQGEKTEDANKVSAHLPDYLKDNLIFPYNTLLQFYAKMSKALNKSAKS